MNQSLRTPLVAALLVLVVGDRAAGEVLTRVVPLSLYEHISPWLLLHGSVTVAGTQLADGPWPFSCWPVIAQRSPCRM